MKYFLTQVLLALASLTFIFQAPLRAEEKLDAARIREITALLPESPTGFAWSITNRPDWQKLAVEPSFADTISSAEKILARPLAEVPDSLFLEFSENGNRTHWQDAEFARRSRIAQFTLAEAFENHGRFLPALEKAIAAVCAEKTWVYPAHDRSLKNFHGEEIEPDLGATGFAAELAEADFVLGEKLSPATRQLIRDNVRRRVLNPFRAMVEGRQREAFWLRAQMNWNAVCVANTVFTALALEPSRTDRAFFAVAGEQLIRNSLRGFTPDGYCAEGVGYWNYGFGHNILMIETLRRATGGKVDLLDDDAAVAPALFCLRAEIFSGIFPTIADCTPGSKPSAALKSYVQRRLGMAAGKAPVTSTMGDLSLTLMMASLETNVPVARKVSSVNASPLRSFFPFGGELISRSEKSAAPFAAVLKGGHNDEPHNHNDVGSFSVVVGTNMVICDPGGEIYTSRTFSAHRYDSKVLNSFGHAVPVIAGQLQRPGRDARGVILETNFSDATDVFKLDIRSAYAVTTLKKLERTFVFQRGARPALDVRDEVNFSQPENFETALVTWGEIKKLDATTLQITDGDSAVLVKIDVAGRKFSFKEETLDEDVHTPRQPIRIGIALDEKISAAVVNFKITPVVKSF
jgi:hypothetical protein